MTRVALLYEHYTFGAGIDRDRALIARGLVHNGADVHVYGRAETRTADIPGVRFHAVHARSDGATRVGEAMAYSQFVLAATRALRRDRGRYDVIDVCGTTAWEHDVLRVHAVQRGEQRRWPERGGASFRYARLRSALSPVTHPRIGVAHLVERLQWRPGHYRRALAVTEEVARDLQEVHAVPPERIAVVPCPIDVEAYASPPTGRLRSRLGLERDAVVALFVGHDFERKGLVEAIEAVAVVDEPVHLVVIGDGPRAAYEERARSLGIADRVHFAGKTESPEEAFGDADLFLLPTREDVWGIATIEALASGLPVVTTEVAGASRVVARADAGVVVPKGSVRALRDAVAPLVRDGARRADLGERGRVAAAAFDYRLIGAQILEEYSRALA